VRDDDAPVPVIAAPTAAGKTALVLQLAQRWPLEVVSADAMQVYRGLEIGTAAPSAAERARVRHHLVGVVEPSVAYSVNDYVHAAEAAIAEVRSRGRVPIVVGGTGYYLTALIEGLPTTPKADRGLQAELEAELETRGLEALIAEIAAASAVDAARTQRNPRRVIRTLEVLRRSGRPPSEFAPRPPRFAFRVAIVLPSAASLQQRVRTRTRALIDNGWLDEVRELADDMDGWATARQAIGYEALRRVLHGALRLEDAVAGIEQATLRYGKRQRTWFRQRPSLALRLEGDVDANAPALEAWLAQQLGD